MGVISEDFMFIPRVFFLFTSMCFVQSCSGSFYVKFKYSDIKIYILLFVDMSPVFLEQIFVC